MVRQKKFDYFEAFKKQVDIAIEMADLLVEEVQDYDSGKNMRDRFDRAHEIEHRGDLQDHEILTNVAADFITPIDREDIVELASDLDDVTDLIESVIQRFYMFNITEMHPNVIEFAKIIQQSLYCLRKSMDIFSEFKKAKKIADVNSEVDQLEEKADVLYIKTIRALYKCEDPDPLYTLMWTRMFSRIEEVCDSCKTVADTMSTIMLKNV